MKIHVLGLPHTQTNKHYTTCAFTQKVLKLCAMMHRRGHEVYHYGAEGAEVECTEHISVTLKNMHEAAYPHPGTEFYQHDKINPGREAYLKMWAARAHAALRDRVGKPHTEILALTWGDVQREAIKGIPQFEVETGIGYPNSWADYRVYESYAWLHMHLGRDGLFNGKKWYWCVIPNSFDLTEFRFEPKKSEDLLFIGRLNPDKGVDEAIGIARAVGCKITIVGQGDPARCLKDNPHVTYLPPVGVEGRRELLAKARAVICPTEYVEPFGGVNIEAQLSGTPVITTDWGAFTETVLHGKTGYRCRTFEQFVWAVKNIDKIDPRACRFWAAENYSLERVAPMYEEFFQQVLNIRTNTRAKVEGFYAANPERQELDWLRKRYSNNDPKFDLSRRHVPPPAPPEPPPDAEWVEAQDWERSWWGLDWNERWDEEIRKHEDYFRLMGLPGANADGIRDLGSLSVLDVGCGPVSILQRSKHGPSRGVDPLAVSQETLDRYASSNTEFLNVKAEDMPVDKKFDLVLLYNCLQHTQDPDAILEKIKRLGREVRIFEWLVAEKFPGHPQCLTEALFDKHFASHWEREIWNVGTLRDHHGGVTRYLAAHLKAL